MKDLWIKSCKTIFILEEYKNNGLYKVYMTQNPMYYIWIDDECQVYNNYEEAYKVWKEYMNNLN